MHHESRKTSFTRSIAGETAPAISDTPIVRLPRVGQVQTGTSALGSSGVNLLSHGSSSGSSRLTVKPGDSFAKTIGGRNDPISPAGAPVVSLPGPSKKRPAAEDLNTEAPKRAKTDLGIHAGPAGKVDQHAVCQNCRVLGGECNHQSRCSECDIQISPCKSSIGTTLSSSLALEAATDLLAQASMCAAKTAPIARTLRATTCTTTSGISRRRRCG